MNPVLPRLVWLCGAEWTVGVAGLVVARGILGRAADDGVVSLFASLWIAGGLGFVGLGLLFLATSGAGRTS